MGSYLTAQSPALSSATTSSLLVLAFLRACAARDHLDNGTNLLPRHQQDIDTLQRTPVHLTEGGEWELVDMELWRLQVAYDLVGIAEAYVEVAKHLIPNLIVQEGDDPS